MLLKAERTISSRSSRNIKSSRKVMTRAFVVDFGWKWEECIPLTESEDATGYHGTVGSSPRSMYFDKDSVTQYFFSSATPSAPCCYERKKYSYNPQDSTITIEGEGTNGVWKILSFDTLSNKLRMRRNYARHDYIEVFHRMSDEELQRFRQKYRNTPSEALEKEYKVLSGE